MGPGQASGEGSNGSVSRNGQELTRTAQMSAFVANGNRVRLQVSIFALVLLFSAACKRDGGSYNFDDASEEAQQAIATSVEFTLTEDVFQKWEKAQANLDKLPASELSSIADPGGSDPVARGIKRLESSPPAKRAIESAGLSVRNFVLATVALAQAVKASQGGVPPTVGAIASNVRFVLAHGSRVANRGAASVWVPPSELSEDDMAAQESMRADTAEGSDDIATGAENAQPTVPQLDDWARNQSTPQPPLPRPRDTRTTTQPTPQVITTPPPASPPPPARDSSPATGPPPKTDSLTAHSQQDST